VSYIEGHQAVSDEIESNERLRKAFQSLAETADGECSIEDRERIWLALTGKLPAPERRELVDRMAREPALAEAWRIASELAEALPTDATRPIRHPLLRWSRSLAAAAAVVIIVAAGVVLVNRSLSRVDTLRTSDELVVETLVPDDAALPREAFRLRWTPGPPGSRYQVRVTTEDLRVVAAASDLTMAELVVQAEALAQVAPGTRLLWQVDVIGPDGSRSSSRTFTARVN
jgi:hypothetical protein